MLAGEVGQFSDDQRRGVRQASHQGVEHGSPLAKGRRLDARLQLGQDGLGQLAVVQAAHLADGDDGAESRQDLDGVAQPMHPQDRRRLRGVLVQGQRQQAGEVVESFQGRRWDNGVVEGLLEVAVLAEPRLLAADHRLLALRALHDRPSDSSDLCRGGFRVPISLVVIVTAPARKGTENSQSLALRATPDGTIRSSSRPSLSRADRPQGRCLGATGPAEKTRGELLRRPGRAARINPTIAGLAYRLCTAFPRLLDGFDSRIPLLPFDL